MDDCAICYKSLASPSGIPSGCSHKFCYVCVKRWASTGYRTCPMCRTLFNQILISPIVGGEVSIINGPFEWSFPPNFGLHEQTFAFPKPIELKKSFTQNVSLTTAVIRAYEQIGVDLATGARITDPIFIVTDNSELVDFAKSGLKNFLLHIHNLKEYVSQICVQGVSQANAENVRENVIEFRQRYAPDTAPLFLILFLWIKLSSMNPENNEAEYVQKVMKYLDELHERAVQTGAYLTEMLKEILPQEDYEALRKFYSGIDE